MTSQLTPEHTTTRPVESPRSHAAQEKRERIYLQPWFLLELLCLVAIVLIAVFG